MLGQINIDVVAQRWRILWQYPCLPHDRPRSAAVQQSSPDSVLGRIGQVGLQFIASLQDSSPPHRFLR